MTCSFEYYIGIHGLVGVPRPIPPQVGVEIKVMYNILTQNKIRGVGATVASTTRAI